MPAKSCNNKRLNPFIDKIFAICITNQSDFACFWLKALCNKGLQQKFYYKRHCF